MSRHTGEILIIPNPKPVAGQKGCDICGCYHGTVTSEIKCLKNRIKELLPYKEKLEYIQRMLKESETPNAWWRKK